MPVFNLTSIHANKLGIVITLPKLTYKGKFAITLMIAVIVADKCQKMTRDIQLSGNN